MPAVFVIELGDSIIHVKGAKIAIDDANHAFFF